MMWAHPGLNRLWPPQRTTVVLIPELRPVETPEGRQECICHILRCQKMQLGEAPDWEAPVSRSHLSSHTFNAVQRRAAMTVISQR
jgi:hypothetical protein